MSEYDPYNEHNFKPAEEIVEAPTVLLSRIEVGAQGIFRQVHAHETFGNLTPTISPQTGEVTFTTGKRGDLESLSILCTDNTVHITLYEENLKESGGFGTITSSLLLGNTQSTYSEVHDSRMAEPEIVAADSPQIPIGIADDIDRVLTNILKVHNLATKVPQESENTKPNRQRASGFLARILRRKD